MGVRAVVRSGSLSNACAISPRACPRLLHFRMPDANRLERRSSPPPLVQSRRRVSSSVSGGFRRWPWPRHRSCCSWEGAPPPQCHRRPPGGVKPSLAAPRCTHTARCLTRWCGFAKEEWRSTSNRSMRANDSASSPPTRRSRCTERRSRSTSGRIACGPSMCSTDGWRSGSRDGSPCFSMQRSAGKRERRRSPPKASLPRRLLRCCRHRCRGRCRSRRRLHNECRPPGILWNDGEPGRRPSRLRLMSLPSRRWSSHHARRSVRFSEAGRP